MFSEMLTETIPSKTSIMVYVNEKFVNNFDGLYLVGKVLKNVFLE